MEEDVKDFDQFKRDLFWFFDGALSCEEFFVSKIEDCKNQSELAELLIVNCEKVALTLGLDIEEEKECAAAEAVEKNDTKWAADQMGWEQQMDELQKVAPFEPEGATMWDYQKAEIFRDNHEKFNPMQLEKLMNP